LKVYGPPPTKEFIERLFGDRGAFIYDVEARQNHPASQLLYKKRGGKLPRPKMDVEANNINSGKILETEFWKVTATRVQHVEPFLTSMAYRFDTPEGNILFAGDCTICTELIELAKGINTLVIVWTPNIDRFPEIIKVCAGTLEITKIARESGIERIVLTHCPSMEKQLAISEVAQNYSGNILYPEELTTIEIRS
jgi:ribonuclease BN (tRNA processing enzyme)